MGEEVGYWCAASLSLALPFLLLYSTAAMSAGEEEDRANILEIARTDRLLYALLVQKPHQLPQPLLRNLLSHAFSLDRLDFREGFVLFRLREGVDVVEYIL